MQLLGGLLKLLNFRALSPIADKVQQFGKIFGYEFEGWSFKEVKTSCSKRVFQVFFFRDLQMWISFDASCCHYSSASSAAQILKATRE